MDRTDLKRCRRVIVKVGTSTITHCTGKLNLLRMEHLARALSDLHNQGLEVILISSGAVGAGIGRMGFKEKPSTLPVKQALAAVGQASLMQMYEKFFGEYGKTIGQVLLTRDAFDSRLRYLNVRNTLCGLLDLGVIPIINENDTVAVDEIKFGDNDTLSALVAAAVQADLLIILSDIDGLYDDNPKTNPDASLISVVTDIPDDLRARSMGRGSSFASGGMYTKLAAADIVLPAGIPLVIASGAEKEVIRRIVAGEKIGSLFMPSDEGRQARKQWIATGSRPQGSIFVDKGAVNAIKNKGGSLLPSGIYDVLGHFDRGQLISVFSEDGVEVARGVSNYSNSDIEIIKGHKSSEIDSLLEQKDYDEVIHRDHLAVL